MGGSYGWSSVPQEPVWKTNLKDGLTKFFRNYSVSDLVGAYNAFFESNKAGFIKTLLQHKGEKDTPKEFPDIEYELKLSIMPLPPDKKTKEPGIEDYMSAFEFPAVHHARFLKDPIDAVSEGVNHFFGKGVEEKLVVIEKGGKLFLKEKSQPLELKVGVPYENLVIKRDEKRYPASMEDILKKASDVCKGGAAYIGHIEKEKGDFFILDAADGRIFSASMNRSHRKEGNEEIIQRQLEIEYAGYVPGFAGFAKNSEKQIVEDLVDIGKQVVFLSNNAPIGNGWRMKIAVTNERKYDFVKNPTTTPQLLELPTLEMAAAGNGKN